MGRDDLKDDNNLISFQQERDNRIIQANDIKDDLWHRLLEYSQKTLNLRDKVRAKHLFCKILDLDPEVLLEPFWQNHLEAWIALEYRNIHNDRVIDLFLKDHRSDFTELEWLSLGQFMATYLSVYDIQKVEEGLQLRDIFTKYTFLIPALTETDLLSCSALDKPETYLKMIARVVRLGPMYGLLEPHHLIKGFSWDVERRILNEYNLYTKVNALGSWRSYMQLNGITVLAGCLGSYANADSNGIQWRRKND